MSPHIKSVDDIVVLGMNLSKFNKLTQFFICVAGVFIFYLIYGYLQVKSSPLFIIVLVILALNVHVGFDYLFYHDIFIYRLPVFSELEIFIEQ